MIRTSLESGKSNFSGATNYIEGNRKTNEKMVFVACVDDKNLITSGEIYGYLTEDEEDKTRYPFIMDIKNGVIDWGGFSDGKEYTSTNLFSKKMITGEYFTRINEVDGESDEYTYQINSVSPY